MWFWNEKLDFYENLRFLRKFRKAAFIKEAKYVWKPLKKHKSNVKLKKKLEKQHENKTRRKVRKSRKIRTSYEPHYISNMQTTYKL